MEDKLPSVWATRDFPVLCDIVRRIDGGEAYVPVQAVADFTGLPVEDVVRAGQALARQHLVEVDEGYSYPVMGFNDVTGEA